MQSIVGEKEVTSEAFERVKSERAALRPNQWLRVDLDVSDPPEDLTTLAGAADALRDRLTASARALTTRCLFDAGKIAALSGGHSYRSVAVDLEALINDVQATWAQIEGKCSVARDEVEAAAQLSGRLCRAVGFREERVVLARNVVEERIRALTLVMNVWSEARSCITYLRGYHNDADLIAPRLYAAGAFPTQVNDTSVHGAAANVPGGGTLPAASSTKGDGK
jgi:hypothetical protein